MISTPLGLLAVELGWVVTEVGRQPWLIQDVLRTSEGVSTGLTAVEATTTLAGFAVVYLGLLALYAYVVVRIVRAGPPKVDGPELDGTGTPASEVQADD